MKKSLLVLLAASLACNAALVAMLFIGINSAPATAPKAARSPPPASSTVLPKIDADIWPGLETDDLRILASRLRVSGFPPAVVRAIIAAQIGESFAARRKALDPGAENRAYWKSVTLDPKMQIALRAISRDQQKALREVLGDEAENSDPMSLASRSRRVGNLPPDKAEQVLQIVRDYDDKRSDLYASGLYSMQRDQLAALEKGQHAAIAQLLTSAELLEYDLRNSNTASSLRYSLTAFNATEEEFRKIFALQQPFDEQFNNSYSSPIFDSTQMRARSDAQKQLTDQIKATLGPDRGAEYERATDSSYRQTSQLVARLELPPETTNNLYAVQQDLQQRARTVQMDRTLAPNDRTAQLTALAAEAQTKVTAALGPGGYEAYKQYGGSWLQILQPRPVPAPRPTSVGGGGGGG